ncbi:hypothetical protein LMG27177_04249 [Paraburkholderia fynbosensis]|uniref:N-acetyltransferase domain-containing protein n=1 Tax=Paraburkholderia fynbosensis TaxID=1200993 RepID=A0A6J5GBX9_9BURK|nr:hypothetical protein LMG27177_04249 [Paraburkholderia fynbosensis]
MSVAIRTATPTDTRAIFALTHGLAESGAYA